MSNGVATRDRGREKHERESLSGLKDGIQMPVAWNWDHRFTAALAIVSDEHAQGVITRLRNTMTEIDHATSLEIDGRTYQAYLNT